MEPIIGELRFMAFGVIPNGWAACNGQLLSVQEYGKLFSLIGVQFGGDGQTNFALPDLRGRVPVGTGGAYVPADHGGTNLSNLLMENIPNHSHVLSATAIGANVGSPAASVLAQPGDNEFTPIDTNKLVAMADNSIGNTGKSSPITNMQPFLGLNICIALFGEYPRPA